MMVKIQPTEIEKFMTDGLFKIARQHAARTGTTLSTIGRYAVADPRFFQRIAKDGPVTIRQWSRVVQWIYDRWPAEQGWPTDVMRPLVRNPVPVAKRGRPPGEAEGIAPAVR